MSVARIDTSRLTVVLDIRQTQACLALGPAIEFGRSHEVEINWLPTCVAPLKPPSPARPDDDRSIRHRRARAQAIAREIDTYAAAQGLVMRGYYRGPDPAPLYRAWLWVREHRPGILLEFIRRAFKHYWAEELDISDEAAVCALAAEVSAAVQRGSDRAALFPDGWIGTAQRAFESVSRELDVRGIQSAPCYLIGDEIFLGRQHLPMIGWILDGRAGPGPI